MKWLRRALAALGIVVILCAAPIAYVETRCEATPDLPSAEANPFNLTEQGYRRAEGDSYLTYPEWYIVHAYTDLAGVTRQSSESAFDYIASVTGFWRSLCRATIAAGRVGPVTSDQKITNYIIGLSFTAEMTITGLYERTIGAATVWMRGPQRTDEDEFALAAADSYAAFLQQTPWYRYPFWPQLQRFWRKTPLDHGNLLRSLERRFALSLEYGGKALYAIAIGALAGYSPADLRLMSVVAHLDADDLAAEPRIKKLRDIGDSATLIETPRYQEYTEILRRLGARGRDVIEIAGNRRILTTIVAPAEAKLTTPGAIEIFSIPLQSRPGWRRIGLDTDVGALTRLIGEVGKQGAEFEHAYDY
ncbi:hypothetical protein [Methylocapsa sp. S129]|uniref:hypothetical protein n=1 Tax=Methylocapsa sp. S129 TaxID=1641869 RepID=UPI00131AFBC0|nr:hypothetical protein [Methylocapsa sp. S129]